MLQGGAGLNWATRLCRPSIAARRVSSARVKRSSELGGRIGQTHPETHPYLFRAGEGSPGPVLFLVVSAHVSLENNSLHHVGLFILVTPGILASEYEQRRSDFVELMGPEAIAIFPAAEHHKMTNDIP